MLRLGIELWLDFNQLRLKKQKEVSTYFSNKQKHVLLSCKPLNVWEAMQQELANFSQFLYQVTPVFIFQWKSWSDLTFCCFVHWELVSNLLKNNPAFYLAIIKRFLNFPPIPQIRSAERIPRIGGNF